jgi:hypothetical protein
MKEARSFSTRLMKAAILQIPFLLLLLLLLPFPAKKMKTFLLLLFATSSERNPLLFAAEQRPPRFLLFGINEARQYLEVLNFMLYFARATYIAG